MGGKLLLYQYLFGGDSNDDSWILIMTNWLMVAGCQSDLPNADEANDLGTTGKPASMKEKAVIESPSV